MATKKKSAAKPKKAAKKSPAKRPNKYEEKLVLNGSFTELVKELITPKKK